MYASCNRTGFQIEISFLFFSIFLIMTIFFTRPPWLHIQQDGRRVRVNIHPKSVNSSESSFDTNCLIYFEKVKSTSVSSKLSLLPFYPNECPHVTYSCIPKKCPLVNLWEFIFYPWRNVELFFIQSKSSVTRSQLQIFWIKYWKVKF